MCTPFQNDTVVRQPGFGPNCILKVCELATISAHTRTCLGSPSKKWNTSYMKHLLLQMFFQIFLVWWYYKIHQTCPKSGPGANCVQISSSPQPRSLNHKYAASELILIFSPYTFSPPQICLSLKKV